jgi:hypothetical protein
MFKRNLFLQLFLVAALSAIGHTSAGTVDADLEGQLPVATSGVANKTTRRVKGMGMGKGKGKGKVSSLILVALIELLELPVSHNVSVYFTLTGKRQE